MLSLSSFTCTTFRSHVAFPCIHDYVLFLVYISPSLMQLPTTKRLRSCTPYASSCITCLFLFELCFIHSKLSIQACDMGVHLQHGYATWVCIVAMLCSYHGIHTTYMHDALHQRTNCNIYMLDNVWVTKSNVVSANCTLSSAN